MRDSTPVSRALSPVSRTLSPLSFEYIDTLPFVDGNMIESQDKGTQVLAACGIAHYPSPSADLTRMTAPTTRDAKDLPALATKTSMQDKPPPDYLAVDLPPIQGSLATLVTPSETDQNPIGLQDLAGIDANLIDRYGFYAQQNPRRKSSSSVEVTRTRSMNERGSARRSLKRASVNLGLSTSTDYQQPPRVSSLDIQKEMSRSEKWRQMATRQNVNSPYSFTHNRRLKARVYKGIPDCWRSAAWSSFVRHSRSGLTDQELEDQYLILKDCASDLDEQINLDVPRTISGHVLFRHRHAGGQRLLFQVLHAIAMQCPNVGYVQGMASVAATLLCYYPEEQAFVMLYRLWTERGLERLYELGFQELMAAFVRLESKMKWSEVGRHLLKIGCQPIGWATRWYLTIFHISVPFHTQLRIWDLFMLHGARSEVESFAVLEATTLALIEGIDTLLLSCEFDQAMRILTQPVDVQDDDCLIRAISKKLRTS